MARGAQDWWSGSQKCALERALLSLLRDGSCPRSLTGDRSCARGPRAREGRTRGLSVGPWPSAEPGYAFVVSPYTAATELADVVLWTRFLSALSMFDLLPLFAWPAVSSGLLCQCGSMVKNVRFHSVVSPSEVAPCVTSLARDVIRGHICDVGSHTCCLEA